MATFDGFGVEVVGITIPVEDISNLPPPSGGVITLLSDVIYQFTQNLDITPNRIVTSGPVALFANSELIELKTSNAAPLITSASAGDLLIRRLSLTNDGGACISYNAGNTLDSCQIDNCRISGTSPSLFAGGLVLILERGQWFRSGLVLSGAWIALLTRTPVFRGLTGAVTAFDVSVGYTAVIFDMLGTHFILDATQTAVSIGAGVLPTNRGQFSDVFFTWLGPPGTAVSGIDQTTVGWAFRHCPGVADSRTIGSIGFNANATETTIAMAGAYVAIAGTWVLDSASERFELDGSDGIKYIGVEDITVLIHATIRLEGASNNKEFEIQLLNGLVELGTFIEDYRTTPVDGNAHKIITLSKDDVLRLNIRNNDDDTNVTVIDVDISPR